MLKYNFRGLDYNLELLVQIVPFKEPVSIFVLAAEMNKTQWGGYSPKQVMQEHIDPHWTCVNQTNLLSPVVLDPDNGIIIGTYTVAAYLNIWSQVRGDIQIHAWRFHSVDEMSVALL